MVIQNLRLLYLLYFKPRLAMSEIIDRGSWLFGAVAVTIVAVLSTFTVTNRLYFTYEAVISPLPRLALPGSRPVVFQQGDSADQDESDTEEAPARTVRRLPLPVVGQTGWWFVSFRPLSFYSLAFSLAVLFVPALVLVVVARERTISFSVAMRRDYGSLLSCTFMAWAAAHLPFALLGIMATILDAHIWIFLALWVIGNIYFACLAAVALATVCGVGYELSSAAVVVALAALRFDSWIFSLATVSPFLTLIWLVPLAFGALAGMRAAQVQRQSFRRYLDACTLNDHDAEAHFQLGLIYQQRRQQEKALSHFRRSVEIDPGEPDANFQLGVNSRNTGRLQEAIQHFEMVLRHDEKFRQSEVWREIGATYLAAGMLAEAHSALAKYHERRPFDPEGLYYLGETVSRMGDAEKGRQLYQSCIEAVQTMPYYRRNQVARWGKMARARL